MRATVENMPVQVKSLLFGFKYEGRRIDASEEITELIFSEIKNLTDRMLIIHKNAVLQGL